MTATAAAREDDRRIISQNRDHAAVTTICVHVLLSRLYRSRPDRRFFSVEADQSEVRTLSRSGKKNLVLDRSTGHDLKRRNHISPSKTTHQKNPELGATEHLPKSL